MAVHYINVTLLLITQIVSLTNTDWGECLWVPIQGPVSLPRSDAVAKIPANGNVAFKWKLHSHWLKFLRERHVAVVIKGPQSYL